MASHVIAYRLKKLLFGKHAFNFNCFLDDFNCVFTQIRCLSVLLEYWMFFRAIRTEWDLKISLALHGSNGSF